MLSPDGKRIAYLSSVDGVLNVWVAPVGDLAKAKPVTQDKKRGIRTYRWAFTNDHVLYMQDKDGDENWHLHAVDLKSGADKDLTPVDGAQARIEELSHRIPNEVLVGINDRDKRFHDLHRVDIATGKRKLVQQNDGFASFAVDHDFKVRVGMKPEKDGSLSMMEPDGKGGFRELGKVPHEDSLTTQLLGFDKTGGKAYLADSRGRDVAALVELDLASKKTKVLLDDGQADVSDIVQHPTDKRVQAAVATYDRLRWHAIDPTLRADLDVIQTVCARRRARAQPRARRFEVDRLDDRERRAAEVLALRSPEEEARFPLHQREGARGQEAREDESRHPEVARRARPRQLPHAAARGRCRRRRQAGRGQGPAPDGARSSTAGPGAATRTRSTRATSGSPHAGTPC